MDICRVCELEKEDTHHLWHCPVTLDEQKRKWQEAIEGMNTIGKRAWRTAKKDWEEEKKKWEDKQGKRPVAEREKTFSRRPPTFKDAQPEQIWETLEVLASGVSAIRNENMDLDSDPGMEIDVMADWKVQDLYHGLTPKTLASKWKRLYATSSKIAAYMAGRFVEMIEGIGKKDIWNKRCEVTIAWEREQGITTKKKRDRTRNEGEQRRNDGGFMGHTQRHRRALDIEEIGKEADRRVLEHYRGALKLDVMERLGGVKFTMTSDTG
jgi:hypothetical protein